MKMPPPLAPDNVIQIFAAYLLLCKFSEKGLEKCGIL